MASAEDMLHATLRLLSCVQVVHHARLDVLRVDEILDGAQCQYEVVAGHSCGSLLTILL